MASFTESFDKADAATLGPDLTWTEVVGTAWGVTSNTATVQTAGTDAHARAEHDLASVDHFCECTVTAVTGGSTANRGVGGPAVRFSASADTCYQFNASKGGAGDGSLALSLSKWVAGSETNPLGATVSYNILVGDVMRLEVVGSTLKAYVNGTLQMTRTDTSITSGTRFGIRGIRLGTSTFAVDNLVAGDLGLGQTRSIATPIGLGIFRA